MNAKRAIATSLLIISLSAGVSACSVINGSAPASDVQTQAVDAKSPAEAKKTFDSFLTSLNAENRAVIKGDSKKNMNTSPATEGSSALPMGAQYPETYAFLDTAALGEANARDMVNTFIAINSIDPKSTVTLDEKDVKVSGNTASFNGQDMTLTLDGKSTKGGYITGTFTMTFVGDKWLITGFGKSSK